MEPTGSTPSAPSRSSPLADRRFARRITYRTRLLASLATVLLLVTIATQLPLSEPMGQVGWSVTDDSEPIPISEFKKAKNAESPDRPSASEATVPPTSFERTSTDPQSDAPQQSKVQNESDEEGRSSMYARDLATLESADQSPEIVGGKGSLYLRIHYPEKAREKGIEGRLVLSFVVDRQGYTHDISVRESLHPLCDSSAVRALRETRFVPARQDGKRIPVRMTLPVRFRLLNASQEAMANTSSREQQPQDAQKK